VTLKARMLPLVAFMAALANMLSVPPIAVTVAPGVIVHFTQLPIFIGGILAGPVGGLMTGAVGGLYMSLVVARIPFIIGGLAILGLASGFFSRRFPPLFSGVLAWLVQAPYVAVTDYVWFTLFLRKTPNDAWIAVIPMMALLTVEAVISSALAEVIVHALRKARIVQQTSGNK